MTSDKVLFKHENPHGHGDLHFMWQTGNVQQYLCTTGYDGTVAIFNRQGQMQERIILSNGCCGFAWDNDGDILALLSQGSSQIVFWDSNAKKKFTIESGLRDNLSCLLWSKRSPILAIGTTRGNLTIYNHQTTKRIPIIGKHSKRIICGAWSAESILALGSEDKTLSLSNDDGDTLKIVTLRDVPSNMCFAEMKTDERLPGENTISMVLGRRTIFLYHLHEPDSPTELGFQNRYGAILEHKWYGDGYILIGFSNGYIVSISTHPKEVGQELWQVRNHQDSLTGIAICQELELIASCGDNTIKIHSMANLQETRNIINLSEQTGIKSIEWTTDGQLLAASTNQGSIYVFITKLYSLCAVNPPRIAILSSLAEVTLYQLVSSKLKLQPNEMQLEIEPSFLGIGPRHLACGMNNHAWFYDLGQSLSDTPLLLGDREYMNEIKKCVLNNLFAAVLNGGHLLLHPIDGNVYTQEAIKSKLFPDDTTGMEEAYITSFGLTNCFLIFTSDLGHIVHFSIEKWSATTQYRHTMGIKEIYVNQEGTKSIIIDDHSQGYIYISRTKDFILIPEFPKSCKGVIWDLAHTNIFSIYDTKSIILYIYIHLSIKGRHVEKISEEAILSEQIPLYLNDGELSILISGGKLTTVRLKTYFNNGLEENEQLKNFKTLRKYDDAWKVSKTLEDRNEELKIGYLAIEDLNIEYAIKIFRSIGDIAMVYALEEIKHIEDINLLSGYCALLLEKMDEAKHFFMISSHPKEALQLCRDLLQNEQALALASSLAPEMIPTIAREYAQQLEINGNWSDALIHYEKGLNAVNNINEDVNNHIILCKSGIARMSIKNGNFQKGIKLTLEVENMQLFNDCADLLLDAGHYNESAQMQEMAQNWDKACELYIQQKNWSKVESIFGNITSAKLHLSYAKAKEQEGNFREAIRSYTIGGDMDSVVRIYIDYLADPHTASEIVMDTKSVDGAKMLAKFFQQIGDYESTLQYLVLSHCLSEAFQLALKQNKLKFYAQLLEQSDNTKSEDFLQLAQHYEDEKYTLLAGKYYFLAKEYSKGLKYLLKASAFSNDENVALSLAVDCVASSQDEKLVNELIECLLGESDGVPKDPKLLFRLYMAKKQYKEAAKTAVIIANQEQVNGNYKVAHELLFSLHQELRRNQLSIASDLKYNLILLHRYMLVRVYIKLGDHSLAARLLIQVAENISQFPSHIVSILTSTVIECQRAGFNKSAFSYAVMLMRPELRSQIDSKYVKKIEAVIRKGPKDIKHLEDGNVLTTECPVCNLQLDVMEISCHQCKTTLPMCIATGQHVSLQSDLAACPECNFLCFKTDMIKIINMISNCPMCGELVESNRLRDITNINDYINVI